MQCRTAYMPHARQSHTVLVLTPQGQVLVLEDNFVVLGLGLESRVLGLVTRVPLEKLEDTQFINYCMFCTNEFKGNNLEFCPSPIRLKFHLARLDSTRLDSTRSTLSSQSSQSSKSRRACRASRAVLFD